MRTHFVTLMALAFCTAGQVNGVQLDATKSSTPGVSAQIMSALGGDDETREDATKSGSAGTSSGDATKSSTPGVSAQIMSTLEGKRRERKS